MDDENISPIDQRIVVVIIVFTTALIGFIGNLMVFLFATTLKSLQNSFGRLAAAQSFAEAILCAVFAFFYSPMVLFNLKPLKQSSAYVGLVLLYCYDVCIFTHLAIAFNRFVAISRPIAYNSIFSLRNNQIVIVFAYAIPCFTSIYMHSANNCLLPYIDFGWYFGVNLSKECDDIRYYIDFCKDFGTVALIGILDIATIAMIRMTAPRIISNQISERRRKSEITFVKQALIQGAAFAAELVFFFIIAGMQTTPVRIFIFSTLSWVLVHSIDPFIIIMLNFEFRAMLFSNGIFRSISCTSASNIENSTTNGRNLAGNI
ncbi:unnamed protein product [Caenorhabditis bovis]|uniref:G-protein coupled receptors family 1 profile domain-containing protein n=1 Tax=Caenorhabditis bovis TaxID=2654633 RepID=A0A8S1EAD5_9PELO|nr:unnamed protein product [Caenorhabditis bovis]